MICILQLGLAALGVYILFAQAVRVGGRVVGRPHTIFAGLLLVIQLPITGLAGVAIGAAEAGNAASQGDNAPTARVLAKKYGWLDPAIAGGATLLAGAFLLSGMRQDLPSYVPPDYVHGVRDYVAEEQTRHDAEQDAAEEWRGAPDPSAIDQRFRD